MVGTYTSACYLSLVTTVQELCRRFDAVLVDAYGVLVDSGGALPGASELIDLCARTNKPYLVVTNDASRSPARASERFRALGIDVPPERILTSGALLGAHFQKMRLEGKGCAVLGPKDSCEYVRAAGGVVLPLFSEDATAISVLVVGDETGFPYLDGIDWALTLAYRKKDRGEPLHMVVPNPDLVYPKPGGAYGFAAGTIASIIEAALEVRFPGAAERFVRLGKPHPPIFEEALRRTGTRNMVMIGDQIETDIRGAKAFGIAAALVTSGVTSSTAALDRLPESIRPDFVIDLGAIR